MVRPPPLVKSLRYNQCQYRLKVQVLNFSLGTTPQCHYSVITSTDGAKEYPLIFCWRLRINCPKSLTKCASIANISNELGSNSQSPHPPVMIWFSAFDSRQDLCHVVSFAPPVLPCLLNLSQPSWKDARGKGSTLTLHWCTKPNTASCPLSAYFFLLGEIGRGMLGRDLREFYTKLLLKNLNNKLKWWG